MRNRVRKRLVLVVFLILFGFLFHFLSNDKFVATVIHYTTYQYSLSEGFINDSFPITFYYEAYLDLRTSPPRLRFYTFNPCIRKSNLLLVDLFQNHSSEPTKRIALRGEPMENYCPSMYAPAAFCFYQPHYFWAELEDQDVLNVDKLEVIPGSHKVRLEVKEIPKQREEGLTVCIQPMYHYTQWQNILLYMEAWRAHGARRFILLFHSASSETLAVLRYYEKLGILELHPWPSFGIPRPSGFPPLDEEIFIYSFYMALNVCLQSIRTELATVADTDELIVPRHGSLLEYSLQNMKGSDVGALRFESYHVAMSPSIYSNNFNGVANPVYYDRKAGQPKHVFNMSSVDIAEVHYIKKFLDPTKITKIADGGMLHFRYGVEKKFPKAEDPGFRFFPNNTADHIENMKKTALEIFNGSLPVFNPEIIRKMKDVGTDVANQWKQCLSKGGKVKKEMDKLNDWYYDPSKTTFRT